MVIDCVGIHFNFIQDNVVLDEEPNFAELTYTDSGRYECEVKMGGLSQKAFIELTVEGKGKLRCYLANQIKN